MPTGMKGLFVAGANHLRQVFYHLLTPIFEAGLRII
jgi:hypothetical protein